MTIFFCALSALLGAALGVALGLRLARWYDHAECGCDPEQGEVKM